MKKVFSLLVAVAVVSTMVGCMGTGSSAKTKAEATEECTGDCGSCESKAKAEGCCSETEAEACSETKAEGCSETKAEACEGKSECGGC